MRAHALRTYVLPRHYIPLWVCSGHVKVDGSAIFLLRDEASEYSGIKVDRSGSVVTEVPR
jgi:hypothetical protein